MAFLLEEDEALKTQVSGITVSDDRRATRPVEVWFGQPDLELRNRTYPYISIELVDINEDTERVQVGMPELSYIPSGWVAPTGGQQLVTTNFPTPYNLDYQITAWSRHPRHDRQIIQKLLAGKLPIRFGRLVLAETNRMVRLDMLEGPRVADTADENGKRLFRKVFTVRVATELFQDQALQLVGLVQQVVFTGPAAPTDFTAIEAVIP